MSLVALTEKLPLSPGNSIKCRFLVPTAGGVNGASKWSLASLFFSFVNDSVDLA